jgi:hypothetical protein
MYFVLFIGTDASLFRDGHIQADKLGDSGPASCGNEEVVSAGRRTVALDAATSRESRNHCADSKQDEEATDPAETPAAEPYQPDCKECWDRTGGN